MITVVGATGNTGRALVKLLKTRGAAFKAVTRDAGKAAEVLGADVASVVADLDDRGALDAALAGTEKLFLLSGHNPQMGEQQINVLEAAKAAGTKYVLKVSGGAAGVRPDAESPVLRGHHRVEEAVKASGLDWTILRPGLFMQNTFQAAAMIKEQGKIILPFAADLDIAFLDVRDIAAVADVILADPAGHLAKTYDLTGVLSNYATFAETFAKVLGKPVAYVQATLDQTEQVLKGRGMPDWLVGHLLAIARLAAAGGFSAEHAKEVRDLAGRAPLTLADFVTAHKAMFS